MSISPRVVNLVTAWTLKVTSDLQEGAERATGHGPATQAALVLLANRPGENIEWLRARLAMSHPGCVRLVDRLGDQGLLERQAAADGRAVALRLTARGRRAAKAIHRQRDRIVTEALGGIGDAEQERLRRALEAMLRAQAPSDEALADRCCRLCEHSRCFANGDECPVDLGFADHAGRYGAG